MEVVDDRLDGLSFGPRRGGESEYAEVLVAAHDEPHDADVRVVAARAVRLVDDEARDVARVDAAFREVVLERLRRAVHDPLRRPRDRAQRRRRLARELDAVALRDPRDVMARLDLLRDERPRWSEENDGAVGVPAVEVEPARRESARRKSGVKWARTHMTQAAMKVLPRPVGRLTRVFSKRQWWTMLYW